jgi:hypothetical protein
VKIYPDFSGSLHDTVSRPTDYFSEAGLAVLTFQFARYTNTSLATIEEKRRDSCVAPLLYRL